MIFTAQGGVPVTLFRTASPHGIWRDEEEVAAFATACELFEEAAAGRRVDLRRRPGVA